jgi:hypothetical protein
LYAVKLTLPHSSGAPQLAVLIEQKPQLTLHDLLEDCETLREERASVRVLVGYNIFARPDILKVLSQANPDRIE